MFYLRQLHTQTRWRQLSGVLILAPGFAVCASIFLFFNYYPSYLPESPSELLNCQFTNKLFFTDPVPVTPLINAKASKGVDWCSDCGYQNTGGIKLQSRQRAETSLDFDIALVKSYPFLQVNGRLRSHEILPGEKAGQGGRIDLFFLGKDGRSCLNVDREVVTLTGTHGWKRYEKVFQVPNDAISARLRISNSGGGGVLWADDIDLIPVHENPHLPFWKKTILGLLLVTAATYGAVLWRFILPTKAIMSLVCLILLCAVIPNQYITTTINTALSWSTTINSAYQRTTVEPSNTTSRLDHASTQKGQNEKSILIVMPYIKRTGHLGLFCILSFMVMWKLGSQRVRYDEKQEPSCHLPRFLLFAFMAMLLVAVFTETAQLLSPSRRARLSDIFIDITGILLGMAAGLAIFRQSLQASQAWRTRSPDPK